MIKCFISIVALFAVTISVHAQSLASPEGRGTSGLSKVHYLCNGILASGPNFKLEGGVVCFNPSPREATSTWTFYTADADPVVVSLKLKPNARTWGNTYPKGAWGLKIESSEPIAAQLFCEHFRVPWSDDFSATPEYERVYNQYSALSVPALARILYLPDVTSSPEPEKLMLIEKQWFTVCNPNKTPAKVKITDNMNAKAFDTREVTVPAERVSHFEMTEIGLKRFEGGAITIESDQPISVLQTRANEGTPKGKFNGIRFTTFTFMLQP